MSLEYVSYVSFYSYFSVPKISSDWWYFILFILVSVMTIYMMAVFLKENRKIESQTVDKLYNNNLFTLDGNIWSLIFLLFAIQVDKGENKNQWHNKINK